MCSMMGGNLVEIEDANEAVFLGQQARLNNGKSTVSCTFYNVCSQYINTFFVQLLFSSSLSV